MLPIGLSCSHIFGIQDKLVPRCTFALFYLIRTMTSYGPCRITGFKRVGMTYLFIISIN